MGGILKNVEATKITNDWFLWMHHTIDKIPDKNDKKYIWQKKNIQKIRQVLQKVLNQLKLKKNSKLKNMKLGNNFLIYDFFFIYL